MSKKHKRTYDPSVLSGLSIYQESKRTVYSPFYSSKGYIVTADNCRHYVSYIQSYLIAMLIFSLSFIITKNMIIALALGLLFIIGNIISFHTQFLRKTAIIDPYKKPVRDNFAVRQAKALDVKNIVIIIICCPILALVLMLNGYVNRFEGFAFYLNLFTSIVAVLYGILHIYILIIKKRDNLQ